MSSQRSARGRGALRGLALLGVLLVWLVLAGFGGTSIGSLSEVQENDAAAFLPQSAESTRAAEAERAFTQDAALPAIVVVESTAELTGAQLGQVEDFAQAVPELEIGDGTAIGDLLLGPPAAVPSEDGRAALITVALDADEASEQLGEDRVTDLVVAELRAAASDQLADGDLETWVTGPAGSIADLVAAFGGIDSLLLLVALTVVFVILVLVYRSPSLPFAVLFTSLFALAGAALAVYQLAAAGVLVLNGQSQGILFILVVGAATDYSLLIVARYREELRGVESPYTAMRRALRASIEPVSASAGTVIAGLLCLLLSDLSSNSSLGPVAAIGIVAAYLAALTLLPALLLVGGRFARYVFWPRMPRLAETSSGDGAGARESVEELEARSGFWGRVSALISRRPRRVWLLTAAGLLVASAGVPTLQASGTGEGDIFLTEVESVAGQEVLAEHFDAGQVQPITVVTDESALDRVRTAVDGVDGVDSVQVVPEQSAAGGPPGQQDEAGGSEQQPPPDAAPPGAGDEGQEPAVVDGRVLLQAVTAVGSETQEAVRVAERVREAVHDVEPDALVGGAAAERLDTQQTSIRDLMVIVPTVLAVILVVLIALLRSVVAPVLIVAANLLSLGATIGISAVVFNHVLDFPGADPTVPLYAFVFLVALGIDYSIFLMTRVREEALVHGTREGVRRGLAVTGGVITSAGVVLAATFGALAVLPLLFLVQLAFLVALGVLIDTLVVRTLLVPGLVHDIGRASWWPWQRRIGP